jgi:CrcB protein
MILVAAVALGGALGSVLRHFSLSFLANPNFPYGTLGVNVLGSFLIGFLMEMAALKWNISLEMRAFLFTGVLGGFTTFSTFSLDVFKLVETGNMLSAFVYVSASVMISIAAIFSAVWMVRGIMI